MTRRQPARARGGNVAAFLAATGTKNKPVSPAGHTHNLITLYAAVNALLMGQGSADHVDELMRLVNLLMVLAERHDWPHLQPDLLTARDAMARVVERGMRFTPPRWRLDGDARTAVERAIAIFAEVELTLPRRDLAHGWQIVRARLGDPKFVVVVGKPPADEATPA